MEEWRDVPGTDGKYQISIQTKEGMCRNTKTGRLLTNTIGSWGYISWGLLRNGKRLKSQAARWIAITYPELVQNEYFEGAEIDHINTNRTDNRPENLRWVDDKGQQNNPLTRIHREEGVRRFLDNGGVLHQQQKNRKDQSKLVIQLSLNDEILHFYPSTHQVERDTGIPATRISFCCRGKGKTAGGYKWKYAE